MYIYIYNLNLYALQKVLQCWHTQVFCYRSTHRSNKWATSDFPVTDGLSFWRVVSSQKFFTPLELELDDKYRVCETRRGSEARDRRIIGFRTDFPKKGNKVNCNIMYWNLICIYVATTVSCFIACVYCSFDSIEKPYHLYSHHCRHHCVPRWTFAPPPCDDVSSYRPVHPMARRRRVHIVVPSS